MYCKKDKRQRLDIVKKKEKNIKNELFNYFIKYSSRSNMLSKLSDASDEINKSRVDLINKKLTKIKNIVKNVPKDKEFKIEENEKIIDIVERILDLNSENQLGLGLKILTPNQMLCRLPIFFKDESRCANCMTDKSRCLKQTINKKK